MRQKLGWAERDEDGRKLEVEAFRECNDWTFHKRGHRTEDWVKIDRPSVSDWERLLDLVERKYQRRRCAWRDVEQVKTFLEHAKTREPNP